MINGSFFCFQKKRKKSAESDRKKTVRGTILNAYYFNSFFWPITVISALLLSQIVNNQCFTCNIFSFI